MNSTRSQNATENAMENATENAAEKATEKAEEVNYFDLFFEMFPVIFVTVAGLIIFYIISLIIAKPIDYCLRQRELWETGSDVSEHTKSLLRAQITIKTFRKAFKSKKKSKKSQQEESVRKMGHHWLKKTKVKRNATNIWVSQIDNNNISPIPSLDLCAFNSTTSICSDFHLSVSVTNLGAIETPPGGDLLNQEPTTSSKVTNKSYLESTFHCQNQSLELEGKSLPNKNKSALNKKNPSSRKMLELSSSCYRMENQMKYAACITTDNYRDIKLKKSCNRFSPMSAVPEETISGQGSGTCLPGQTA